MSNFKRYYVETENEVYGLEDYDGFETMKEAKSVIESAILEGQNPEECFIQDRETKRYFYPSISVSWTDE